MALCIDNLPEELILRIFHQVHELEDLRNIALVCRQWHAVVSDDTLWKNLYKLRWLTDDFESFVERPWKIMLRDRLLVEMERVGGKKSDILQREAEELQKAAQRGEATFSSFRCNRFVAIGDTLRDYSDPNLTEQSKLLIAEVAQENYASAIAQDPRNYIAYFSWSYILHCMAKSFAKSINAKAAYHLCFKIFERATSLKDNILREDTFNRWGDALHDYAKTHRSRREIIALLEQAYEKFETAVKLSGDGSFLVHDYWGLALLTHAKLLKPNTQASDALYEKCYEHFRKAHTIKGRDGFVLCHWGTALQQQASTRDGDEGPRLYREAFAMYAKASALLPEDAFILRSWGDALHDCAKKLIHVAESPETCTERREELLKEAATYLEEANVRFDAAVKIRKDYSNALNNWGLCLSTHARFLPENLAEELFKLAYSKFEDALSVRHQESYIICNWGMTLLNHARKKAEAGKRKEYEAYMAAAYEKFQPLLNADNLDPWALFCVARWAAIDNRYDECRYWLEKFQERDNYLPRATTGQMNYFKNVEHFHWYKDIIEKSKRQDPDYVEIS